MFFVILPLICESISKATTHPSLSENYRYVVKSKVLLLYTRSMMNDIREKQDVRSIVTADAPYAGNVIHIPQEIQQKARHLCWKYNVSDPLETDTQAAILKDLLGTWSDNVVIMPNIHFDYGINTHFAGGQFTFVNFDCVFLDTSPIYIGEDVFIGPKCVLACAGHPINYDQRRTEPLTQSKPIHICNNVWLGACVTVLGGVTIGEGSVVAAGSVVTKDIPAGVVACGVPCRVIRPITEADRIKPQDIQF